ncbi:M61 family metallopeptidase [Metallosphaera cuprina]|uniref:Peptidase M61 domain-containing protein n=1 Tax=Metallosphaera cuprina (strain Ar-4) TaxID=1006006 RepID=F4FYH4_METCR|nr:PDZ domain-containing protein [Metallosphaera cuprina]AEB95472.1 peptidase M61 domain-containing protein [Metallosphaera cuprina Ar-4]
MIFKVTPKPRYVEVSAEGREGFVTFPTYLPGSYVIRELERNLVDIEGVRVSKNKFYVKENFKYRMYAASKDQREAISTQDYLFINPPAVFPFQDKKERYCVKILIDWPISTTLKKEGDYFCADDYETFIDSPIQASPNLKRIVIDDHHEISTIDELDVSQIRPLIREIDNEMGSPERYIFFFRRSDRNYGGIEHLDSSAIVVNWERSELSQLLAHEYFHRWNVRKFRPKDMELNLETEGYSELLWFAEGITDYVAWYVATKTGSVNPDDSGKYVANALSKLTFPGAKKTSLAEASRTTWIKYYRQDENFLNSSVSYYEGGLLVGLLLDIKLRQRGGSIFEIFRNIPERYTFHDIDRYLKSRGIDELEEMIYSPSSIILDFLKEQLTVSLVDEGSQYFGVILEGNRVVYVEDNSPADSAGLMPQDLIVGVNGASRSLEVKEARLIVNREGRLIEMTLRPGRSPGHKVKVTIDGPKFLGIKEIQGTSTINII